MNIHFISLKQTNPPLPQNTNTSWKSVLKGKKKRNKRLQKKGKEKKVKKTKTMPNGNMKTI